MNVQKILNHPRFGLHQMGPIRAAALEEFLDKAPDNLPVKYLDFMKISDGAAGESPYDSGHIEIWPLGETLEKQAGYGSGESLPGFFAFGSDGSGRDFVFDLRDLDGAAVYSVPTSTRSVETLEEIAPSFSQFLEHIVLMQGGA
jgi:hypothetical protein